MSSPALTVVSSDPLPSDSGQLHVVSSDPLPDNRGVLSRAASFVGDTLSKTARKYNVEDALDKIEDIGDRLKNGDWSAIHDVVNSLPTMQLGNKDGLAPSQLHDLQDTYQKIKAKDYSGAAANVLPYLLANHEAITGVAEPVTSAVGDVASKAGESIGNAADVAGTAIKGATTGVAKANLRTNSIPVHVTSAALSRIPGVGPDLAVAAETAYNGYHAVKGASEALAKRAADKAAAAKQAATEAAIAEQRANPRPSLADQAGIADAPVDTAQPSSVTPEDISEVQRMLRARIASRVQPAPEAPEPNVVRQQVAETRAKLADAPVDENDISSDALTPEEKLDAASFMAARLAARRQAQPLNIEPPKVAEDVASAPVTTDTAPAQSAPIPSVPDDIKDIDPGILQGIAQAHGIKNFAALPIGNPARASLINIARAVSRDTQKSAQAPAVTPSVPAVAPFPANTPAVEPSAPLARAVPAEPVASTAVPAQAALPQKIQLAQSAADVVKDASQEYYQPTGRATNGRIIPTPAELGHGIAGTPDSSATLRVAGSENEKAFNIADYLFNEGIKNPAVLDDPAVRESIDKDFMEKARQYGQKAGNAVPRNAYATVLHGKTLDLAKAHLERLVDDERNGRAPKYQDQGDMDLSDLLSQSLQNIKKPSTVSDIIK